MCEWRERERERAVFKCDGAQVLSSSNMNTATLQHSIRVIDSEQQHGGEAHEWEPRSAG